ncbi:quinolinate synthase NadA [Bacillus sp. V5-8f]|uniref:quinolinate synthase NadA n=1 Tax=Bacillus sp. V5-8f TaxID=2053044 RepID=UPI000C7928FF|nr:quinolinate synthase NadA [Bacillus sp. V5-8f]PLT32418.1 quinolinate synthase [Bacillus sp. V5-8f]
MNLLQMADVRELMLPEKFKQMETREMEERVQKIKQKLGKTLFIPGHHYQREEVIQFADATGDSLQLAQLSANNHDARYIVFCGVHFMAETADILTSDGQTVILPDMRAGCSMADMADIHQTERAWDKLQEIFGDTILPLTYVNSTADIKAFVGRNGGATVTSSNAKKMLEWAFTQKERILFLPDQHLGRNTAYDIGIPTGQMAIWDPHRAELIYEGNVHDLKVLLWKGHCSVHENFTVLNIERVRTEYPDMNILVHPECTREVVEMADFNGSTSYIINKLEQAPPGTQWAIGTESNLVKRLIALHPDKKIISLNENMCPCLTMNRIDLPHLLWSLESIEERKITNHIKVEKETAENAILALQRMLERA